MNIRVHRLIRVEDISNVEQPHTQRGSHASSDEQHSYHQQQQLHINAHAAHAPHAVGVQYAVQNPAGGDTRLCTRPPSRATTLPSEARARTY